MRCETSTDPEGRGVRLTIRTAAGGKLEMAFVDDGPVALTLTRSDGVTAAIELSGPGARVVGQELLVMAAEAEPPTPDQLRRLN